MAIASRSASLLAALALAGTARPVAAAPAAAAPAATAPTPGEDAQLGPDEVQLRDGGFVRGTLIEVEPGRRVVIVPAGATPREIPWSDVLRVERGKHAPADGASRDGEAEPTPGRPRIHLDVRGDTRVTLFEVEVEGRPSGPYGAGYRSVCVSPCDLVVDGTRGQDFFVARDLVTASRRFTLLGRSGEVSLRVQPGSRALRILGGIALALGVGGVVAGALFTIGDGTRIAGYAMLGAGGAGIAAGIPMIVFGRTRWKVD